MPEHVAIVGGGFSGTLQAINLLRHDGPRATLIERRASVGRGLAYGEAAQNHLLNVRAKGMAAFPDEPDGFVRWLERRGLPFGPDEFVPRLTYGQYLRDLLEEAMARNPGRLTLVLGEAVGLDFDKGTRITLSDGRTVDADLAVLAVGNLPPHDPPGFSADLPADLYASDPWADDGSAELADDDIVLLLGTGLTMVDVALRLRSQGFGGQIVALSRRGLLPHRHDVQIPFEPIAERPKVCASTLVREVRERAEAVGWRNAVDELRRFTGQIWRAADVETRQRFVRHLRPWWDIHRHRLAPKVAERIAGEVAAGTVRVVAASTVRAQPKSGGLAVTIRPRGQGSEQVLHVRRAINCTGPQGNLTATPDPLLQALWQAGTIRPDPLAIGIDVDQQSRTIAANGSHNDRLLAIGPMTRGASWEIVAVPDIRQQVWNLARRLSNAHWVGGEGL